MDVDVEREGTIVGKEHEECSEPVTFMSVASKKRVSQDITHSDEGEPPSKKSKLTEDMAETNVRL